MNVVWGLLPTASGASHDLQSTQPLLNLKQILKRNTLSSHKGNTAYLHLKELSGPLTVIGCEDWGMDVHEAIVLEEEENSSVHLYVKEFREQTCILLLKWHQHNYVSLNDSPYITLFKDQSNGFFCCCLWVFGKGLLWTSNRLALNSWSSCLSASCVGIVGIHYHTWRAECLIMLRSTQKIQNT